MNGQASHLHSSEQYSLETPILAKIVKKLIDKGYKLDLSKIHNMDTLIDEIKGAKK
jgi:hypothetical protein